MGEKHITIRAMFKSDESETTQENVTKFIRECYRAYDWWQDNRSGDWETFKGSFPLAHRFLMWRHDDDVTPSTDIVGQLSWAGYTHPRTRTMEWQYGVFQYRTECWSGAEIHPIAVYLMAHFKAGFASSHDGKYPSLHASPKTWEQFRKQQSA